MILLKLSFPSHFFLCLTRAQDNGNFAFAFAFVDTKWGTDRELFKLSKYQTYSHRCAVLLVTFRPYGFFKQTLQQVQHFCILTLGLFSVKLSCTDYVTFINQAEHIITLCWNVSHSVPCGVLLYTNNVYIQFWVFYLNKLCVSLKGYKNMECIFLCITSIFCLHWQFNSKKLIPGCK